MLLGCHRRLLRENAWNVCLTLEIGLSLLTDVTGRFTDVGERLTGPTI